MLFDYFHSFTLGQAAKYLSEKLDEDITVEDIIRLGAEDKMRLSVYAVMSKRAGDAITLLEKQKNGGGWRTEGGPDPTPKQREQIRKNAVAELDRINKADTIYIPNDSANGDKCLLGDTHEVNLFVRAGHDDADPNFQVTVAELRGAQQSLMLLLMGQRKDGVEEICKKDLLVQKDALDRLIRAYHTSQSAQGRGEIRYAGKEDGFKSPCTGYAHACTELFREEHDRYPLSRELWKFIKKTPYVRGLTVERGRDSVIVEGKECGKAAFDKFYSRNFLKNQPDAERESDK